MKEVEKKSGLESLRIWSDETIFVLISTLSLKRRNVPDIFNQRCAPIFFESDLTGRVVVKSNESISLCMGGFEPVQDVIGYNPDP